MLKHVTDVKLNVKPVFTGMEHQYYYEGPCRFGHGEENEPGYDALANGRVLKGFLADIDSHIGDIDCFNVMEPTVVTSTDGWDIKDEFFDALLADNANVDVYITMTSLGTNDYADEFARRCGKPIIPWPGNYFTLFPTAGAKNMGADLVGCMDWDEIEMSLRVLLAQKVLANANVLLAPRFNSERANAGGSDTFVSQAEVTRRFGTNFRYVNMHELLDDMKPLPEGGNHTTPGRADSCNVTEADVAEMEKMADELMAGAQMCCIDKQYLVNSLVAWRAVQKVMDYYDCMGFAAPCPDMCSTRRVNEQKFTMCLAHSLNLEQGIASACEYDVTAALCMLIQMSLSRGAAYMGNTIPILRRDGVTQMPFFLSEAEKQRYDGMDNLYLVFHSTTCRKLRGFEEKASGYALRHFAFDQKFGAVFRHDFNQDEGQKVTFIRISGDLSQMLIGRGTILGDISYDTDGCGGGFVFQVEDSRKLFHAQTAQGLHIVYAFGDYTDELTCLAKRLGLEPVLV